MKSVIGWIKSNVITVISTLLILLSLGVIGWAWNRGSAVAGKASSELQKMVSKLDSYSRVTVPFPPADVDAPPEDISGVTINQATLKRLDEVYGKMTREYQRVMDLILSHNQRGHGLLVPGVLPTSEASHLRHEARAAYRQAFIDMMEPYDESNPDAARLNATSGLNPAELQFELQRLEEGFRPSGYGGVGGAVGAMTEADRRALEGQKTERALEMLTERARQAHIYADTNIYSPAFPFQVGQWSLTTGLPTLEQIWEGHLELWVQQDIVKAIAKANHVEDPKRSIIEAPVKRLISITVIPGYVGITSQGGMNVQGADRSNAAGMGMGYGMPGMGMDMGYGDMGMPGMGSTDSTPTVSAGSPDEPLGVNFYLSPSGRYSNAIYDVKHARVVMIVDYQQLPELFNAINEVNFMSVLDCEIQDVDEYEALREGFVYGPGDAVKVDMLIESIWLREWTTPLMPKEIKQQLGLSEPSANAQAVPY